MFIHWINSYWAGYHLLDPMGTAVGKRSSVLSLFFLIYFIYYLFLAVLDLQCCLQAFSSCGKWGLLLVVVNVGYTLLQCMGFSLRWLLLLWNKNGDIVSQEEHVGWDVFLQPFVLVIFLFYLVIPCGMWNLNSLARDWTCTPCTVSRLLTTGLPGTSHDSHCWKVQLGPVW